MVTLRLVALSVMSRHPCLCLRFGPECQDAYDDLVRSAGGRKERYVAKFVRTRVKGEDGIVRTEFKIKSKLNRGRKSFRCHQVDERFGLEKKRLEKRLAERKAAGKLGLPNPGYRARNRHARQNATRYVHKRIEELVQLEAYKRGYLQAVVEEWGVFIPREKKTSGFSYIAPNMLGETYRRHTELKFEGDAQRVLPLLLSHLLKLFKARLRKADIPFRSVDVMEVGNEGGYHFHCLVGFPSSVTLSAVEVQFRNAWHAVSGNSRWQDWFKRIDSGRSAAAYVTKMAGYLTKQHLSKSRVRSSQYLFLSKIVRDRRLVQFGFLPAPEGGLESCWMPLHRKRDDMHVGYSYRTPFTDAQLGELSEFTFAFVNFEFPDVFGAAREFSYPVLKGVGCIPADARGFTRVRFEPICLCGRW